jgi:hypothetical protein
VELVGDAATPSVLLRLCPLGDAGHISSWIEVAFNKATLKIDEGRDELAV